MTATRDWSLASGERQTSPHFADANAAHRARYQWAVDMLRAVPVRFGADVFSATGYGTAYLSREIGGVWEGFDGSHEAVALAATAHPHLAFSVARFPCPLPVGTCDAVVSIESIEHVEDDRTFAAALVEMLRVGGDLLVSVPNEDRIPAAAFGNRFHVRHYTPDTLTALFAGLGLEVIGRYGQRIHRFVETAYGPQRRGRVDDALQGVQPDPAWDSVPCALLAHYRRVA